VRFLAKLCCRIAGKTNVITTDGKKAGASEVAARVIKDPRLFNDLAEGLSEPDEVVRA